MMETGNEDEEKGCGFRGGVVSYSTDGGATWGLSPAIATETLRGIGYGDSGTWVVVGSQMFTSTGDMNSWTERTNPVTYLNDVAYNGTSRWVAVGEFGFTWYSDNDGGTGPRPTWI